MQKLWLINYIYVEDEGSFDYLKIIINSLKLDMKVCLTSLAQTHFAT